MTAETAPKKPKDLEARIAKGFVDRDANDIAATEAMMAKIREVYELYGFAAVETPFIEYTDALGKFLPDQDRPNAGVFSFQDDDDQWLSLRYDLTAPLARFYAENHERLPKPYRSYRAGWVFRNEKPGPGRYRQFMQFDADTVGAASVAADAEICMMAADTLEALGIKRGDYVIKVNNRKVLDGVMEAAGVREDQKLTVLRAIDKADKFPPEEIKKLLMEGRKDESGDFTKGAGLSEEGAAFVLLTLSLSGRADGAPSTRFAGLIERLSGTVGVGGFVELDSIEALVRAAGYGPDRIRIDPSVVRGLEYYTGPVFEAELTFEVKGEDGRPIRFGSVGGGGRYDGLVSRFLPEPAPATGFSIGVSRLLAALKAVNSPIVAAAAKPGPVVVVAMDKDAAAMAGYQQLVSTLRKAGIAAEMYLGSAGMKPQMKYADRRGSCCVVIQGSNERNAGVVQIKDLVMGATITGIKDRAEYLAAQAEAQFTVPVADLVAGVRRVLARRSG
ncbi:MAG TPA: histidine--tRNA ligase [Beijerinckiaceae bacterium]|nr:histidine--tRNA ligase [Beijerinckiaceae bacterium]